MAAAGANPFLALITAPRFSVWLRLFVLCFAISTAGTVRAQSDETFAFETESAATTAASLAPARAVRRERPQNRAGLSGVTWQEALNMKTANGSVSSSVANFRGFILTYERTFPIRRGRFALLGGLGGGGLMQASGGGTSTSVPFQQGKAQVIFAMLQPAVLLNLNTHIAAGVGSNVIYRSVGWQSSAGVDLAEPRPYGLMATIEIEAVVFNRLLFRQSYGVGSLDVGPFWRWGVSYIF